MENKETTANSKRGEALLEVLNLFIEGLDANNALLSKGLSRAGFKAREVAEAIKRGDL